MKLIIAGSRTATKQQVYEALESYHLKEEITEVVCGMARGADLAGKEWAEEQGIPVKMFPANWDKYGRSAGPRRNYQMAEYADRLVVIWDGQSKGTFNMLQQADNFQMPAYIHYV